MRLNCSKKDICTGNLSCLRAYTELLPGPSSHGGRVTLLEGLTSSIVLPGFIYMPGTGPAERSFKWGGGGVMQTC